MKKNIVRLTEADLVRLVKKIIKEQGEERPWEPQGQISASRPDEFTFILKNAPADIVNEFFNLSNWKEGVLRYISFIDCEYVDFSNANICDYPELQFVNVKGSANNFEDVVDCNYIETNGHLYDLTER